MYGHDDLSCKTNPLEHIILPFWNVPLLTAWPLLWWTYSCFRFGLSSLLPWIPQQKKLFLKYNLQRRVSWGPQYLFDYIWDSVVQFGPLAKGMCHPNWLHTPTHLQWSAFTLPLRPRSSLLPMRFKDESSTVALRALLFCDNFSFDCVLLKYEFMWHGFGSILAIRHGGLLLLVFVGRCTVLLWFRDS